jgi:hypothetical protein
MAGAISTIGSSELVSAAEPRRAFGPWLWGPLCDCLVFAGSSGAALLLVAVGRALGFGGGDLPEWGWLAFVLCIDVAHVYATLFRTYFDGEELFRHRVRYVAVPIAVYLAGVGLYARGSLHFWRVLAYLAVFHFIRQQVGWMAVYRARAQNTRRVDVFWDSAAIYAAALYPLLEWHARLQQKRFYWFVPGDFIDVSGLAAALIPVARVVWIGLLLGFFARQLQLFIRTSDLQLGKLLVVISTALIWYVGIVVTNSDFDFTVTNVIAHGVPYLALLWSYARERRKDRPGSLGSQLVGGGIAAFLGVLVALAFVEELMWDKFVWNDRPWLFGSSEIRLDSLALTLLVPLLALPQAVHYVLDGMLWRRRDTRLLAAQRRALGFEAASSVGTHQGLAVRPVKRRNT